MAHYFSIKAIKSEYQTAYWLADFSYLFLFQALDVKALTMVLTNILNGNICVLEACNEELHAFNIIFSTAVK